MLHDVLLDHHGFGVVGVGGAASASTTGSGGDDADTNNNTEEAESTDDETNDGTSTTAAIIMTVVVATIALMVDVRSAWTVYVSSFDVCFSRWTISCFCLDGHVRRAQDADDRESQ